MNMYTDKTHIANSKGVLIRLYPLIFPKVKLISIGMINNHRIFLPVVFHNLQQIG